MDDLDRAHSAFTAGRTFADIDAGQPKQDFLPCFGLMFRCILIHARQKLSTPVTFHSPAPVPQQAEMPDFDEPVRQHMKKEHADKFIRVHRHDFGFVVIRVIPPSERDFIIFHFHDAVGADRNPVSISAEILKNIFSLFKRRLLSLKPRTAAVLSSFPRSTIRAKESGTSKEFQNP
jgi:hypothetical protein